jgi:biopolymer transport protein TolR
VSRGRSRQELRNISQLDVTPLVDLTFILLIVFMITAPALEYAVDVSPPKMRATEIDAETMQVVTITQQGQFVLKGQTLSWGDLVRQLSEVIRANPKTELYLRADEQRYYGEVMRVMRQAKACGFTQVFLVTGEEE